MDYKLIALPLLAGAGVGLVVWGLTAHLVGVVAKDKQERLAFDASDVISYATCLFCEENLVFLLDLGWLHAERGKCEYAYPYPEPV